jgi:hypothetical protein
MEILRSVDGGGVGQPEGREGRVHEGRAMKVEAENCEGSSVEDSKVCVDKLAEQVDSHKGHEDTTLGVRSQRVF